MLNCSEVECILHHDHYYHQLHQLQHHLEDGRHHHAMPGEPDDRSDAATPNVTDSDAEPQVPPDLSHLEGPNESVYMICGVLIAMVLVALIIVLLALTISKLRKRDDNQSPPPRPTVGLGTTTTSTPTIPIPLAMVNNTTTGCQPTTQVSTIVPPTEACPGSTATTTIYPPQFLWQYPAPYSLYSNDQDTLVHTLPAEQPGSCRGFRKNLRGRWRRLVKKKPTNEVYTIPAELRDQLKQIYVY